MQVWVALGGSDEPHTATRLLLLAAAVTVVALLNFIPFVGWVVNFTLVLIGVGANRPARSSPFSSPTQIPMRPRNSEGPRTR